MKETITIAGHVFRVEPIYAEGHTVTANEAAALNQVRAENLRNNFAGKVKASGIPVGGDVSALQTEFDGYASTYQFGIRALGGGGTNARRDPIESEARRMVLANVRAKLKEQGRKIESVDPEKLEALIANALASSAAVNEAGETLLQVAAKAVEAKNAAKNAIGVDTSDLGEPVAPAEEPKTKRERKPRREAEAA